jgi:hypothetical protein
MATTLISTPAQLTVRHFIYRIKSLASDSVINVAEAHNSHRWLWSVACLVNQCAGTIKQNIVIVSSGINQELQAHGFGRGMSSYRG